MENVTAYVERERRGFGELALSDVDMLALCALLYAEFERVPAFVEPGSSVRVGDLLRYATAREYVEHDCNPFGMEPLVAALASSPRFGDVRIERFRCEVAAKPAPIQFGAACYVIGNDQVVVAFRGTDSSLVGWQEGFEMPWREVMPGQKEALRYLHEAALAYPEARLTVCGHSKGGCEAEFAVVFASENLAARIDRMVSFDGPSLFKRGGCAAPGLEAWDLALLERYRAMRVPLTRYVFPSKIGLLLERRDPRMFTHVAAVDPTMQHNVCSTQVRGDVFVPRLPSGRELRAGRRLSDAIAKLSVNERRFLSDFIIEACERADVGIDFSDEGLRLLARTLLAHYRESDKTTRRTVRRVLLHAI